MKLIHAFDELFSTWRPHFAQARTFERARGLAFSSLVTLGRHTVARLICSKNEQDQDWSADYRFYSEREWHADPLFFEILQAADPYASWPNQDVLVVLDDTARRKTGKQIPGVCTLRDPMSLPYHVNLIPGIRYLQGSVVVNPDPRLDYHRAIPILFDEAAPAKKPRKTASPEAQDYYKEEQKEKRLSVQGHHAVCKLRGQVDRLPRGRERRLVAAVDGSFCNKSFLRALPEKVLVIARARKDLRLFKPATPAMRANRVYGERLPTPQAIRLDDSYAWCEATVFFAGKPRRIRYKTVAPVLWPGLGNHPGRLIIIAPLGYRLRKGSKKLYRQPVYLLSTDLETPVAQLHQAVAGCLHENRASKKLSRRAESTGFVTTSAVSSSAVDLPVDIIAALLYADA